MGLLWNYQRLTEDEIDGIQEADNPSASNPFLTEDSNTSLRFKGDWDASTNTPTLLNTDTSVEGFVYKCSVAGTVDFGAGNVTFSVGDIVFNNGNVWDHFDSGAGLGQTLQSITDNGNSTTNDIIQVGGKIVSPEFETSGASLQLSQRVRLIAFGNSPSFLDIAMETKNLPINIPYTTAGTSTPLKQVLGARFNVVSQPIDTDLFTGNSFTSPLFTGTGNFVTEILTYKFQDAGKPVRVRTIADNGADTFDLFGTSEDPYLYFTSLVGLTALTLPSPISSNTGVEYTTTISTVDSSDLNILGDNSGASFNHYLEVDTYNYSENQIEISDIENLTNELEDLKRYTLLLT